MKCHSIIPLFDLFIYIACTLKKCTCFKIFIFKQFPSFVLFFSFFFLHDFVSLQKKIFKKFAGGQIVFRPCLGGKIK